MTLLVVSISFNMSAKFAGSMYCDYNTGPLFRWELNVLPHIHTNAFTVPLNYGVNLLFLMPAESLLRGWSLGRPGFLFGWHNWKRFCRLSLCTGALPSLLVDNRHEWTLSSICLIDSSSNGISSFGTTTSEGNVLIDYKDKVDSYTLRTNHFLKYIFMFIDIWYFISLQIFYRI